MTEGFFIVLGGLVGVLIVADALMAMNEKIRDDE